MVAIALFYSLLLVDVYGQYYSLRFSPRRNVYYHNDIIRCYAYNRQMLKEEKSAQILIRQLTNVTHVELSSCPLHRSWRTRCTANLINGGCGRVNLTCSVVRNETEEEKVTEEIIVIEKPSIKSFHVHHKGLINDNYTQIIPSGSLIEVICRGNVSVVNRKVFQNLTFCWRGPYGSLKVQDPTRVTIASNFNEECKSDQTISAFLYLKGEQMDAYLTCETGYSSKPVCGWGTSRKSIRIKTIPERHQILGPVVVYKDELEERSLLSMTCKTTTDLYNSTDVKDIQWCIRKDNNTQYGPLPLQEDPNVETFNRSMEKTIKSSVIYQILKSDENVEIICETNYSNTCGSGTLRGTVHFNSKPTKTPNPLQNDARVSSDQPNTQIYASASVMIASIIILIAGVAALCKAKERVKYETNSSSLKAAADKINRKSPKAKTSNLIKCKTISEKCQNQTSSGGQTYSNIPVLSGGGSKGVYKSNEADDEGNIYEPMYEHDDDQHVYEGKPQSTELYEDV